MTQPAWCGPGALCIAVLTAGLCVSGPAAAQQEKKGNEPKSQLFDVDGDQSAANKKSSPKPAPPAEPAGKKVDLLALIHPAKDASNGAWTKTAEGDLVSPLALRDAWIEAPYHAPEEYDFVVEFTRVVGDFGVAQILARGDDKFAWILGGKQGKRAVFSTINKTSWGNSTDVSVEGLLRTGKRHRSVVSVRKDGLATSLDGRELLRKSTRTFRRIEASPTFPGRNPGRLGVGSTYSTIRIHRMEVVEVSGRGEVVERTASDAVAPAPVAPGPTPPTTSPAPAPAEPLAVPAPAPPADGRGLRAELFADVNFTRLVKTRYDADIDFVWREAAPDEAVAPNQFAVRWTGFLRAPEPGAYKIVIGADNDMRVWLDDKPILEGGGWKAVTVELGKQPHALRVEFREFRGNALATMHWVPPGSKTELIVPAECFFHDRAAAEKAKFGPRAPKAAVPKGTGVDVEVYAGHKFEGQPFKRVDRQIDWYWEQAAIVAGGPADHLSLRFRTWLKAPKPGRYKLILASDDGHRLRLDGRLLLDQFKRGHLRNEVLVDLADRPHELVIDYYEDSGPAFISLRWEQVGGFGQQIVPPEAFFTDKAAAAKARR